MYGAERPAPAGGHVDPRRRDGLAGHGAPMRGPVRVGAASGRRVIGRAWPEDADEEEGREAEGTPRCLHGRTDSRTARRVSLGRALPAPGSSMPELERAMRARAKSGGTVSREISSTRYARARPGSSSKPRAWVEKKSTPSGSSRAIAARTSSAWSRFTSKSETVAFDRE